jgi:hypothetical protein
LHERSPRHYGLLEQLVKLRSAMTGGTFESGSRTNVTHDDQIVRRIWLESDRLVDDLWKEFENAHELPRWGIF